MHKKKDEKEEKEEKEHDELHDEPRCRERGKGTPEGYVVSKRNLWLAAGGALGALALLGIGKASSRLRPAVVGLVREGYAFKEWAAARAERVKEDMEDIAAEAKHAYHKDLEASQETIRRERELLKKMEEAAGKKRAGRKTAKEQ